MLNPESKYDQIITVFDTKNDVTNQLMIIRDVLKWKKISESSGQFTGGFYTEIYQNSIATETAIFDLSEDQSFYKFTLRKKQLEDSNSW